MASKRGNNEGSVYKRADGRWVAQVTIDRAGGIQRRKYIYGKTREEVAKKLTEALKAVQDDVPLPSGRTTVAGFANAWLKSVQPSIRYKTGRSYESALRVHLLPTLGHLPLSRLTPSHLERLYADLLGKGLAPGTVLTYHKRIHTMLAKAVRLGVLARNVSELVDLPRNSKQELPMFTRQQAKDFLAAAKGHRLEALFALAITTGARQAELLGLTWDRVNLEAGELVIKEALQRIEGSFQLVEPKSPHSERRLALTPIAVDALRRHRVRQAEEALRVGPAWVNEFNLVFTTTVGTSLDRTNVLRRQLRPLLQKAELPPIHFHALRHIASSLALGEGVPVTVVSQMLGHASPAITLGIYAHAIPGAQREAAQALQNLLAS